MRRLDVARYFYSNATAG